MGRTRVCLKTKQDRRSPLLRNPCVPEMCRAKTSTRLSWQEKEGLDYPFPPHGSDHLRRKHWGHICFSTHRAAVTASPWSSLLRHSLSDGEVAAVGCRVQGSHSPFHLGVCNVTVGTTCALTGSVPFSGHQQLWSALPGHILAPWSIIFGEGTLEMTESK